MGKEYCTLCGCEIEGNPLIVTMTFKDRTSFDFKCCDDCAVPIARTFQHLINSKYVERMQRGFYRAMEGDGV